jgi:hypothetical protein
MDPTNPPVLLLDENSNVMGLEWEAADVGQGPMKLFGQTIELQPGHPGVEVPHYMLHIYFKPDGKVLFGTDAHTAFDPEGVCPEMSASASALPGSGGAFPLTALVPLALLMVGTGILAFRVVRRG